MRRGGCLKHKKRRARGDHTLVVAAALSGRRGRQEIDIAAARDVKAVAVFAAPDFFLPRKPSAADGTEQIEHSRTSVREIGLIIARRAAPRKEKFGTQRETC